MDHSILSQEGARRLEELTGSRWTDFNLHDPGITILEQLCYALADLGYRAEHPIPDLLAEGGADPYRDFHLPEVILTSKPVTPADLRRVALDVTGVRNAWVEPLDEDLFPLYYHPPGDLTPSPEPLPSEPIALKGLHRVLIEASEDAPSDLRAEVAKRLYSNRPLGEDFARIALLSPFPVAVRAVVEVDASDALDRLRAAILQTIADTLSSPVPFCTLEEMLAAGVPMESIFEGPRLRHGFLPAKTLADAPRKTAIHTSDLLHAIADVPGVRTVSRVDLLARGQVKEWSLDIPADSVARLDREASSIVLRRAGKLVDPRAEGAAPKVARKVTGKLRRALPEGRDRHVARYDSVRHLLPACYGVGDGTLSRSAPLERRARADQLRTYLLFFDQLMANHLAQLAHAKALFSPHGEDRATYFTQPVEGAEPGPSPADSGDRRARFLNHLLARFAEALDDPGTCSLAALTDAREKTLRDLPALTGGRGAAANSLAPRGTRNRSGLEQRLSIKLGLLHREPGETRAAIKEVRVVEHILLRPASADGGQSVPLLTLPATSSVRDPYSLQLTVALRCSAGFTPVKSGARSDFQSLVEETIRAETPAHLTPHVLWVEEPDWPGFAAIHDAWLEQLRLHLCEDLGIPIEKEG